MKLVANLAFRLYGQRILFQFHNTKTMKNKFEEKEHDGTKMYDHK